MNFACPTCHITLQAEPDLAGKTVKCPGCSTRIQIPDNFGPPPPDAASDGSAGEEMAAEYDEQLPELTINSGHVGPHPSTVSVWIGGGIGLGLTFAWYILMFLFPKTEAGVEPGFAGYLRQLFCERGTTQYVTTLLTFWCMGLLFLKWRNLRQQRRAMLIQALPTDISEEINTSNLKAFHDHVTNFPKPLRNTYIVNRIRKALEFFYVRQNNPEVAQMITSLSEVDAAKANGSYGMVKVFLWAIPIMGFIGTVVGIGAAIGGFGAVFGAGEGGDMSQIKEPLLTVLGSMGVAFDTTLLALVFSIMLSFPASSLQGQEMISSPTSTNTASTTSLSASMTAAAPPMPALTRACSRPSATPWQPIRETSCPASSPRKRACPRASAIRPNNTKKSPPRSKSRCRASTTAPRNTRRSSNAPSIHRSRLLPKAFAISMPSSAN